MGDVLALVELQKGESAVKAEDNLKQGKKKFVILTSAAERRPRKSTNSSQDSSVSLINVSQSKKARS